MNKLFFVLILLILLPSVFAADIAYIVKTPFPLNSEEIAIRDLLINKGHSVEILDDDSPIMADLYDIIIVGEDVTSVKGIFDNKNHKTLFLSYVSAKNAGLSKYSGTTSGKSLIIENTEHFITKEIGSGSKTLYTEISTINYLNGCKAKNSKSLAYKSDSLESSLLVLDKDSLLLDESGSCSKINIPINERNLFFGLPKASKWDSKTETLFINSIKWLLHGSDKDGDGFYYEEDCNDNNASIYPGAKEIPYNSVDENCDGYDLDDVDSDGYKAEVVGGNDCNDNDASINPGSSDIYKNCKNDAPIISPISKIIVHETEIVRIEANAIDPEDDSLSYSINDSRFSQQDNVFTWQTDYNDSGDYIFTVIVSDGNLSSEKKVGVDVKNKNQIPACNEIPALEWNEDEKATLDLKNYCYDNDGDSLYFYVNETSSSSFVSLDSFENGVAEFSSEKDWNGEDWIIFKAGDSKDSILTNKVTLKVLPVNDAPVLKKNLQDITWDEDTNLTNYLNLSEYFDDIDGDKLIFDVTGNHFVNITIENGLVSFYPEKDWAGEEAVFFIAKNSEFSVNSNAITLKVLDLNEPPEFEEMNCSKEILEDVEEVCELKASDFENGTLSFSVVNENKLNCEIKNNVLEYISSKDYNGKASCLIRVSDSYSYDEFLLEVDIMPVNDAPVIKSYSPSQANIKILENTEQLLSILAEDVDSSINISWFLDNLEVGSGSSYSFNKEKGIYEVKVYASDGIENVTKTWNVFVGSISDFTCSEVSGDICSEKEICLGNLLGVKNTNSCCSVPCSEKPPTFEDADKCENISEKIEVKIEDPNKDEKFMIGETINVKIKVKNEAEEDLDFDVEAYLYDITEDDAIEDAKESVSVDEGDSEDVEFEFNIPEDLDEKNSYAIFVKAYGENEKEYCNENYAKIKIDREKEDIVIEGVDIEEASCGDYFDANVKVKNIGSNDEDVSIKIENSELNISEKSEEFEIEKYDKKDEATKSFNIKIPDNASGSYKLKISVVFNGEEATTEKDLVVECKKFEEKETEKKVFAEKISLQREKIEGKTEEVKETEKNNKTAIFLILSLTTLIIMLIIIYLFYVIFRKEQGE